jgi:hypothetical protein
LLIFEFLICKSSFLYVMHAFVHLSRNCRRNSWQHREHTWVTGVRESVISP